MVKIKSNISINIKKIYKRRKLSSFILSNFKSFPYKILLKFNGLNHYKMNIFNSFCRKYKIMYFSLKKSFFKGNLHMVYFTDLNTFVLFNDFLEKILNPLFERLEIIQFFSYSNLLEKNSKNYFFPEFHLKEIKKVGYNNIKINLVNIIAKNYLKNNLVLIRYLVLNLLKILYFFSKLVIIIK